MQDDGFEWDDTKAERNRRSHKIPFELARKVFEDPLAIEWDDDRERAEQRLCRVGIVEGHLLFVAFTYRAGRVRLISARPAERVERRRYHERKR
jgi:uncharacterized DUF497 family protein